MRETQSKAERFDLGDDVFLMLKPISWRTAHDLQDGLRDKKSGKFEIDGRYLHELARTAIVGFGGFACEGVPLTMPTDDEIVGRAVLTDEEYEKRDRFDALDWVVDCLTPAELKKVQDSGWRVKEQSTKEMANLDQASGS